MNPFVQNIKLDVIQLNTALTSNKSLGSEGGTTSMTLSRLVERVDRTSIFKVEGIDELMFKDLGPSGRDLLIYITYHLPKEKDYIQLIGKPVCIAMEISRGKLQAGLNQLTTHGLIARRDIKTHWINPIYMYNGDRVKYFKNLGKDNEYINIVTQLTT